MRKLRAHWSIRRANNSTMRA